MKRVFVLSAILLFPAVIIAAEEQLALYEEVNSGEFMTRWLICGPFAATAEAVLSPGEPRFDFSPGEISKVEQARQFDFDYLTEQGGESYIQPHAGLTHRFNGQEFRWVYHQQDEHVIDFLELFGENNHAVVYLYAEVLMPARQELYLALGSDDSVKGWLNGKLIHERWVPRSLSIDEDIITVELEEGLNRLLFKVQNELVDWGFVCRLLSEEEYAILKQKKRTNFSDWSRHYTAEDERVATLVSQFSLFLIIIVVIVVLAKVAKT